MRIPNIAPVGKSPRRVVRDFHRLVHKHGLQIDGEAKGDGPGLLRSGYTPKYEIELFGTRFFLCNRRDVEGLKVMPAYVLPGAMARGRKRRIYARVFYKDSSLVWRCASHYVNTAEEKWIGKGSIKWVEKRGEGAWYSAEETTNLPFEMQAALDEVSRRGPRGRNDKRVLALLLRSAPAHRVWPYQDFEGPREAAMRRRANQINRQRPIAWFEDDDDPRSLKFVRGYEPDFRRLLDQSESRSTMYGGKILKQRFASRNQEIQYLFVAGKQHVWLIHPQAFTTELSSFGVRTVDVVADEDLFIPGYEFSDNTGEGVIDDQIPPGFAGDPCPLDPSRADASPWNDKLPIIRAFRRTRLSRV